MENKEDNFEMKHPKSPLAQSIQFLLPLIEEMVDQGCVPLCVIGIKQKEGTEGVMTCHIATQNDIGDRMVADLMKGFASGNSTITFFKP
jgi:hypothetical protein